MQLGRRFAVMALATVLLVLAGVTSVWAEEPPRLPQPDDRYARPYPQVLVEWPKVPITREACEKLEHYEPTAFHLLRYTDRVKIAGYRIQEYDECVWMRTNLKDRYVVRPKGTKVAYDAQRRDLFDFGSPGHLPCGNPRPYSFPIVPKPVRQPEPVVIPEPELPPPDACPNIEGIQTEIPRGMILDTAGNCVPLKTTTYIEEPEEPKESHWGITGSTSLTRFTSEPINGWVSDISGQKICLVEGRTFDVGLAYRKNEGPSYWRFTAAWKSLYEGSYTQFDCPECDTEVTTTLVEDARVLGLKVERVQAFGPKEWRVHPALTAHVGAGSVSGTAEQRTRVLRTGAVTTRSVRARELLGSDVFPIVGAGIGITTDISKHVTLGITALGFEYPGIYWGGVTLTLWR